MLRSAAPTCQDTLLEKSPAKRPLAVCLSARQRNITGPVFQQIHVRIIAHAFIDDCRDEAASGVGAHPRWILVIPDEQQIDFASNDDFRFGNAKVCGTLWKWLEVLQNPECVLPDGLCKDSIHRNPQGVFVFFLFSILRYLVGRL
jgi:hypothetical protein